MYANVPTILIYHDRRSKTHRGSLPEKLRQDLGSKPVNIIEAGIDGFRNALITRKPKVVILPEIHGERSFYSRHISKETQQLLYNFVQNGGLLKTICASVFEIGGRKVYHPPKGVTKIRDAAHVFGFEPELKMFGPLPGKWNPQNDTRIPILVKTNGGLQRDHVWYGNGPCILPFGQKSLPSNLEPLAYSEDTEGQPIVAGALHIGKGQTLMSGPLSHYSDNLLWRIFLSRIEKQLFETAKPPVLQPTS